MRGRGTTGQVDAWITDVGTSGFTMAYATLADGDRAVLGQSVQVLIEEATGDAAEIFSAWLGTLDRYRADEGALSDE